MAKSFRPTNKEVFPRGAPARLTAAFVCKGADTLWYLGQLAMQLGVTVTKVDRNVNYGGFVPFRAQGPPKLLDAFAEEYEPMQMDHSPDDDFGQQVWVARLTPADATGVTNATLRYASTAVEGALTLHPAAVAAFVGKGGARLKLLLTPRVTHISCKWDGSAIGTHVVTLRLAAGASNDVRTRDDVCAIAKAIRAAEDKAVYC